MRRSPKSIFAYTLWVVIPIGMALLVALWWIGSNVLQHAVRIELKTSIERIATAESQRIRERLDQIRSFARSLADNEIVINGLIDSEGRGGYLPAFFRSLSAPASADAVLMLVDYKGRKILANKEGFEPVNLQEIDVAKPHIVIAEDEMRIVEPVYYSKSPEGAIVLRYPAAGFAQVFGVSPIDNEFLIVGSDGVVAYSTNPELASAGTKPPMIDTDVWLPISRDLPEHIISVVFASSLHQAFTPISTLIRTVMMIGFICFMILILGLTILAVFLISRPLERLAESIAQIEDVDGLTHRLEASGPIEITRLAQSFNTMATRLDDSVRKRDGLQRELREAQKLEAVGQLAGGIAHEINTPAQYVGSNLKFLADAHRDLSELLEKCLTLATEAKEINVLAERTADVDETRERIDLDFLHEEIPAATEQSIFGIEQISRIVLAMKEFSHPGAKEKASIDLNRAIENVITISRNEWKHHARVETTLDPTLPVVPCLPGELNQVLLNLIVNAAHAITDAGRTAKDGLIHVTTAVEAGKVVVWVEDNGTGIPEEIRGQIFNPFFTTKQVGKGSGQGLAIARDIIIAKHGGTIRFDTEAGKGTRFTLDLPLASDA
jgi:signal transduction histidine kinase